jgi:hypothetical protein
VSLRTLFRDALEAGEPRLVNVVVQYLYYYLQDYDSNNTQMQLSYTDFCSKKELVVLFSDYSPTNYKARYQSLSEIISSLKARALDTIFFINGQVADDYQIILVQYLENQGYLVIKNRGINVAFWDGPSTIALLNVVELIAATHGISVMEISHAKENITKDMKMDKSQFHKNIHKRINQIQSTYDVVIEIDNFRNLPKASVRNNNQFYLNFDHETLQSLLTNVNLPEQVFEIYLLGIQGLRLP